MDGWSNFEKRNLYATYSESAALTYREIAILSTTDHTEYNNHFS